MTTNAGDKLALKAFEELSQAISDLGRLEDTLSRADDYLAWSQQEDASTNCVNLRRAVFDLREKVIHLRSTVKTEDNKPRKG